MAPIMLSQAIVAQLLANKVTVDCSAAARTSSSTTSLCKTVPPHILIAQYLAYAAICCLAIATLFLASALCSKYKQRRRLQKRAQDRLVRIHGRDGKGWFDPYTIYIDTTTREQRIERRRRLGRDIVVPFPTQHDVDRISQERQRLAEERGVDIVGRRPRRVGKDGHVRARRSVVAYANRTGTLHRFRSTRHYRDMQCGNQLKPARRHMFV